MKNSFTFSKFCTMFNIRIFIQERRIRVVAPWFLEKKKNVKEVFLSISYFYG